MAGEAVPQRMRMHPLFQAGPRRIVPHHLLNAAPGQTPPVAVDEQRLPVLPAAGKMRTPVGQIIRQRLRRRGAVQGPAFLAPLAAHQNLPPFPVNIPQVHPLDLRQPHPAGIQNFQDGAIPQPRRRIRLRRRQQAHRLVLVQKRRQRLFHLHRKRPGRGHRRGLKPPFLHQKVVKRPQRRQLADDANSRIPLRARPVRAPHRCQMRHIPPQKLPVHRLQPGARLPAVPQKGMQIVQIDAPGVLRKPPLPRQMPHIPPHQPGIRRRAIPFPPGGWGWDLRNPVRIRNRIRPMPTDASRQHSPTPATPPRPRMPPPLPPAGRPSICTRCRILAPAPPAPSYPNTADTAQQPAAC